jgi:hypothetical protein
MLNESPANDGKSRDFTYGDESFWRPGTSRCVTELLTMSNFADDVLPPIRLRDLESDSLGHAN